MVLPFKDVASIAQIFLTIKALRIIKLSSLWFYSLIFSRILGEGYKYSVNLPMSFKKINPLVVQALANAGITQLSDFGQTVFSGIKSGQYICAVAPKGTGKTMSALVACFNKVHSQYEGSPRVLYITSSIEESERVYALMKQIASTLDVTVDLVHEKGDQVKQRNDIFDGTEIIIGTAKRIFDLYVQNGIHVKLLTYFIIDDLELVLEQGKIMEIKRLMDGVQKTQIICLANEQTSRVEQFLMSAPVPFNTLTPA